MKRTLSLMLIFILALSAGFSYVIAQGSSAQLYITGINLNKYEFNYGETISLVQRGFDGEPSFNRNSNFCKYFLNNIEIDHPTQSTSPCPGIKQEVTEAIFPSAGEYEVKIELYSGWELIDSEHGYISINAECTDSDGGENYYEKGVCYDYNNSQGTFDRCGDLPYSVDDEKDYVVDYRCEAGLDIGKECVGGYFKCPNGCLDGECLGGSQLCEACEGGNLTGEVDDYGCAIYKCPEVDKPVCGDNICEEGEDEVCVATVCQVGQKDCPEGETKCYYTCPEDCKLDKFYEVRLNDKFKLPVGASAKVVDYNDMEIEFLGI